MARVTQKHNLEVINPSLSKEWHPTKNGTLTPRDVTAGSGKKVWWICSKGHEWQARVASRNSGSGCPYCSGHKICDDNCLQTVNPSLAKQWHPTKNGSLTPKDVTPYSNKKACWICDKGHEWEALINSRSNGTGCPYCSGNAVCEDNCLQTVNPSLAVEWHRTRNGNLTPKDVTPSSHKKVWWTCKYGHEWKTSIANRNKGTACPYCAGKRRFHGRKT